jgi:hypothetical protein
MKFRITLLSIMKFSITTLSIMKFNIMTLRIKGQFMIPSIRDTEHSNTLLGVTFYLLLC